MALILKHLKTLKNAPTCFDLYSDHPQGARSFLVKVTEFKITKNIKGPSWQCSSIRLVCMYGVLCGDVSWTAYSLSQGVYVLSVFKCFNVNVID
jgi:hypothetical protein